MIAAFAVVAVNLAMLVQGRLWWTEQNLRMALAPGASPDQHHPSATLLRNLEQLLSRLLEMCEYAALPDRLSL